MNIGEQIVGDYLRYLYGCTFVDYNVPTITSQGEIDVVAINLKEKKVYFCEVAIHTSPSGLRYTSKGGVDDNTSKIFDKFIRILGYAKSNYDGYECVFMFWSPLVRIPKKTTSHSTLDDLKNVVKMLKSRGVDLHLVVNDSFKKALEELRKIAVSQTKDFKSPIMRLYQIEGCFKD